MNHSHSTEFGEILALFEDYIDGGYRRTRPERTAPAAGSGSSQPATADSRRPSAVSTVSTAAVSPAVSAPPAAPAAELSSEQRAAELRALEERVRSCALCALHQGRTNAVPGVGVLDPLVMVIGEGPGADEDAQGEPFVGAAGRYLDKWLEAINLSRTENVYITNIVKCRPPNNRDPLPAESAACTPYLARQIELVRPQAILSVGRVAGTLLLDSDLGIGKLRGRTWSYRGIPLVPTYHPSGVLRNDAWRRPVWEDLKRLRGLLDERLSRPGV